MRHGMWRDWARTRFVREKLALRIGLGLWLVGHVLPAGAHTYRQQDEPQERALHCDTSAISSGSRLSRNARVVTRSKRASVASMQRKNRSCDARSNSGRLNIGWYG